MWRDLPEEKWFLLLKEEIPCNSHIKRNRRKKLQNEILYFGAKSGKHTNQNSFVKANQTANSTDCTSNLTKWAKEQKRKPNGIATHTLVWFSWYILRQTLQTWPFLYRDVYLYFWREKRQVQSSFSEITSIFFHSGKRTRN